MKRTGYKDKTGKPILEGQTVGGWFSAPWDEQVPIFRTFRVVKIDGLWMCEGVESNGEDDLLKEFKGLEIVEEGKP